MAYSEETAQTYIRIGVETKGGVFVRADQYNQVYYSGLVDRDLSTMASAPLVTFPSWTAFNSNAYNLLIFEPKVIKDGVTKVYYTKAANTDIGGFSFQDDNGNEIYSEPIQYVGVPLNSYNQNAGTPFPPDWTNPVGAVEIRLVARYNSDGTTVNLGIGLCASITDDAKAYYPALSGWKKFCNYSTDPDIQEWFDKLLDGNYWEPGSAAPYEPEGGAGGDGYFYKGNEEIGFPSVPSISAASTGFMSVYAVDAANLQTLANELWQSGTGSFYDLVVKNYQSPMENIISLGIIPFTDIVTVSQNIKVGNYQSSAIGNKLTTTFYEVDLGVKDVEEYYNTFADYASGGTKLHLFLPFCGWIECNVDEFMGKSMWIKYLIDVLSGSVVAHVAALNHGVWQVVYTKEGNFKSEIPISGANFMAYYSGVMGSISQVFMGAATNNPGAVANGMVNAISAKPQYQRGGNISGTSGLMSIRNPYLIFEIPNMWIPENFKALKGYVSNYKCRIGDQTGFIKASIQNEELTSFSCTEKELEMIKQALSEGIYI